MKKRLFACLIAVMLLLSACASGSPASKPVKEDFFAEQVGGEITIYCYEQYTYQNYLETAAKLFEEKYPGTKVNIKSFSAMPEIKTVETEDGGVMSVSTIEDDPQAIEDYIRQVSTELMGGGGADILAMDVLPFHRYAKNGQLEDLQKYMDADSSFNAVDYRQNIFEGAKFAGGLFAVPADYYFDFFEYDSTLLNDEQKQKLAAAKGLTHQDLIELASGAFEAQTGSEPSRLFDFPAYSEWNPTLFRGMLRERYGEFVDLENGTANFADGTFAQMLQDIKSYDEKGYLSPPVDFKSLSEMDFSEMNTLQEEAASARVFYKTNVSLGMFTRYLEDSGIRMSFTIGSAPTETKDDEIAGIKKNSDGSIPFRYNQAYALNANSQNKRTAWEFIKFLLSEEMQEMTQMGFPVHNQARADLAKLELSGNFYYMEEEAPDVDSITLTPKQQELYDAYTSDVETFSDQLTTLYLDDSTIEAMIDKEIAAFFDGSKSAEEVSNAIQNKVELYLSE